MIKSCTAEKDLVLGSRVHALVIRNRCKLDAFLANHIICMYASHGRLEEATQVFTTVASPSRHMWASIILAHARNGQSTEALRLYRRMQESNVRPDNHIFVAALKSCASAGDLSSGRKVHSDILRSGNEPSVFVGNCLVDMYAKCGSLEDARHVFDNLLCKNVVTWNSMIAGYAQHGMHLSALKLYTCMQQEGVHLANSVTFACLLQACATAEALSHGKEMHSHIKEQGLEVNGLVGNCLVNMYAKCGSLQDARRVFENLPSKDVITWTTMIAAYSQQGLGQEALSLYESMREEGVTCANHVTFVSLLQACAQFGALHHGKQLHAEIQQRGLGADVVVATCLIDMYSKCGSVEDARKVFDNLPIRDVVTWTAMIAGYAQHGLGQEALALYANMQQEGITPANYVTFVCLLQACGSVAGLEKGKEIHSLIAKVGLDVNDLFLASSLIDMYAKCGSMGDAQQVFDALTTRDIVTWNALIAGYARQGESERVFDLFNRTKHESILPNGVTFLSILTVCSHLGLVDKGQKFFEAMTREYAISPGIEHYNCMVDLLGRGGYVETAVEMVDTMPLKPDGELWRSVLGACQKWRRVDLGQHAFECAVRLDKNDAAAYVLMANIYAAAHMRKEATEIRLMRLKAEAWKKPGQSRWTDIRGLVHTFVVGDREHPEMQPICVKLEDLFIKMKEEGYAPQNDCLLQDIADNHATMSWHSKKLAMAFHC